MLISMLLKCAHPVSVRRKADRAKSHRARAIAEYGEASFEAVEANNQWIVAWAALHFGRPMHDAAARALYRMESMIGLTDVRYLFHGGLINRKSGRVFAPSMARRIFGWIAIAYIPLAIFGGPAFAGLVFASDLSPAWKPVTALCFLLAFVGQALHGLLILRLPLQVYDRVQAGSLSYALN